MKKEILKFFAAVAALVTLLSSCSKEEAPTTAAAEPDAVSEVHSQAMLVSATKTGSIPVTEAAKGLQEVSDSSYREFFKARILGSDILDFEIVTYRIKYRSVVRDSAGFRPAVLTGSVSFMTDMKGILKSRTLESVTLVNTIYNTSAKDIGTFREYFNLRAVYNALVVFPHYQGGDASDGFFPTPSEFLIKGRQAIDCELAALEFVESMENVQMMKNYCTENVGISNGGGPALAVPYLLEKDSEYRQYADKINLKSSFVGEGNCSNSSLLPNLLKKYEYDGEATIDMNALAPVGYLTTIVGTYVTWKDKYFQGVRLEDYFSEEFLAYKSPLTGMNGLEQYMANVGSMMSEAFVKTDAPTILETVNPDLLEEKDGEYSYREGTIMDNMFEAFKENEAILSGWNPRSSIRIAHSVADEFLPYKTNFAIWKDLSRWGFNPNVEMETALTLEHMDASEWFLIKDVLLKKHPNGDEIL